MEKQTGSAPASATGDLTYEFPTENTLSVDQLLQLMTPENQKKLKPLLSNPKLRSLILNLDNLNSDSVWKEYESAMKVPEFTKFVKLLLRIVDKNQVPTSSAHCDLELDDSSDEDW